VPVEPEPPLDLASGDDDSADEDLLGEVAPPVWLDEIPEYEIGRPEGILRFRSTLRRDRQGIGHLPRSLPTVAWSQRVRCSNEWCGVGWTGQPLLVDWSDEARAVQPFAEPGGPAVEVVVGGLDGMVYFVDLDSGDPSRPAFRAQTASIKGTMSIDPRGPPLLYVGQGLSGHDRDWHYKVVSLIHNRALLDIPGSQRRFGGEPLAPTRSWGGADGNALILEDSDRFLLGGESGLVYRVDLGTDWEGQRIGLDPDIDPWTYHSVRPKYGNPDKLDGSSRWAPGIESSVALHDGVAYFADSLGSLIGLDHVSGEEVLRLDLGDDTDATPVISIEDGHPYLYVGTEVDKQVHGRPVRATGVMRFSKIDLEAKDFAWRLELPAWTWKKVDAKHDYNGGVLATAALGFGPSAGLVFVPTSHEPDFGRGRILAIRTELGEDGQPEIAWSYPLGRPSWSSPACDGETLVVGDAGGVMRGFDAVSGELLWELEIGGAIESSPVFWDGRVVVGTRGGQLVGLVE